MARTDKILGQSKPAAATPTVLYTVPASTQAEMVIYACNQDAVNDTVKVELVPVGGTVGTEGYILFLDLSGISTQSVKAFLNAGEAVRVESVNGTSSFNATGAEYV